MMMTINAYSVYIPVETTLNTSIVCALIITVGILTVGLLYRLLCPDQDQLVHTADADETKLSCRRCDKAIIL